MKPIYKPDADIDNWGLCCDCKHLPADPTTVCCDYTEQEGCPRQTDDGSCWEALHVADLRREMEGK